MSTQTLQASIKWEDVRRYIPVVNLWFAYRNYAATEVAYQQQHPDPQQKRITEEVMQEIVNEPVTEEDVEVAKKACANAIMITLPSFIALLFILHAFGVDF
ncbi:MAG: hypothetical protein ACHQU0_00955 [Candidatus Paceibacteria bacterium]